MAFSVKQLMPFLSPRMASIMLMGGRTSITGIDFVKLKKIPIITTNPLTPRRGSFTTKALILRALRPLLAGMPVTSSHGSIPS